MTRCGSWPGGGQAAKHSHSAANVYLHRGSSDPMEGKGRSRGKWRGAQLSPGRQTLAIGKCGRGVDGGPGPGGSRGQGLLPSSADRKQRSPSSACRALLPLFGAQTQLG